MIVDVHGHVTPPELLARFPMPPSLGDIEGMLEAKAAAGIDVTIVGSPVGFGTMMPVPGLDNYGQSPDQLGRFHDWLHETVAKHPGRLAAYAYTNPLGDDELLDATARTVREGGFVGLIVNSSVRGEYLDSERAEPFFAMAAELDAPVLLHPPAEPVGHGSFRDFRLVEQVARWNDVAAGLVAIIFAGWLERFPTLRVIGATGGGGLALLVEKLDTAFRPRHWSGTDGPGGARGASATSQGPPAPTGEDRITKPPSAQLDRIFVDTATPSPAALRAALEVFGPDNLLFATDSPPLAAPLDAMIASVRALAPDEQAARGILGGNATRLFALDGPG